MASVDTHGFLSACEWLDAADAPRIVDEAQRVLEDPDAVARLQYWVRHYFGDTSPGAATARFHAAIETLMQRWEDEDAHSDGEGATPDRGEEADFDD